MSSSPSAAHPAGSGQALAVLAAGAIAGLAAVAAAAALRRMLRRPAITSAVRGRPDV
ncbi:hypothetical protein [Arthrobacter sp.]|uniref:hypothetical protein n=1 Tax=Arthrobacter sp. TaxID=1667 RepID=UPI002896E3F3|nr:hypothetical protein [Arthrobacter sp.]